MNTYTAIILLGVLTEVIRRCIAICIDAFTGPLSKIPGPFLYKLSSIPWTIEFFRGTTINTMPLLFAKYGDVVRVTPGSLLVAGKDGIQKILKEEDFRKDHTYELIRDDPNITNMFSETDKVAHKAKRRLLSHGFSISYLNGLEPLMHECVQELEDVLRLKCKGNGEATVDINKMMNNVTFDIMSATSFGGSFHLVKTDDTRMKDLIHGRIYRAAIDATFPFLKNLPFVQKGNTDIVKVADEVIARRRAWKGEPPKDLVQLYVDTSNENPDSFTHKHIMEEMMLLMIAGSDSSGSTATFTLSLLVQNPNKLRILREEIDKAFPLMDEPITFAKTQDLPYLNAVLYESMRVCPITQALPRLTTYNTVICGYEVPAETPVAACVSAAAVDERYWPDAKSFIPERWLGEYKGVEADRQAYAPFSIGSRNCIGQQFAWRSLRLIFATLVRRFDLDLVPKQSYEQVLHTMAHFKQGFYNIKVKPRTSDTDLGVKQTETV